MNHVEERKQLLKRIVSILTRGIAPGDIARRDSAEYNADGEGEYAYRHAVIAMLAVCEYEPHNTVRPEPTDAAKYFHEI